MQKTPSFTIIPCIGHCLFNAFRLFFLTIVHQIRMYKPATICGLPPYLIWPIKHLIHGMRPKITCGSLIPFLNVTFIAYTLQWQRIVSLLGCKINGPEKKKKKLSIKMSSLHPNVNNTRLVLTVSRDTAGCSTCLGNLGSGQTCAMERREIRFGLSNYTTSKRFRSIVGKRYGSPDRMWSFDNT